MPLCSLTGRSGAALRCYSSVRAANCELFLLYAALRCQSVEHASVLQDASFP